MAASAKHIQLRRVELLCISNGSSGPTALTWAAPGPWPGLAAHAQLRRLDAVPGPPISAYRWEWHWKQRRVVAVGIEGAKAEVRAVVMARSRRHGFLWRDSNSSRVRCTHPGRPADIGDGFGAGSERPMAGAAGRREANARACPVFDCDSNFAEWQSLQAWLPTLLRVAIELNGGKAAKRVCHSFLRISLLIAGLQYNAGVAHARVRGPP